MVKLAIWSIVACGIQIYYTAQHNSTSKHIQTGGAPGDAPGGQPGYPAQCFKCGVVLDNKYALPSHIKSTHMPHCGSLVACPLCTYRVVHLVVNNLLLT